MSTIETRFPASRSRVEAAVFVADHDRRARLLRYGGAAAIAFVCLWLAGLSIGMLGLGDLPGVAVQIPGVNAESGDSGERSRDAVTPSSHITPASSRPVAASARNERIAPSRAVLPRAKTSQKVGVGSQPTVSRPRTRSQPGQIVQPPAQPTLAPAPVNRGWTRQGWTAPPGRVRPSPAEPVRRHGEPKAAAPTTTTTTTTTPAPFVPPGQQKKADEPTPTG